tara:strand:+ start:42 stop:524 length:483 start_codon:yes stop_codon:yes gene_type:complete
MSSRQLAILYGHKTYEGKLCKKGHTTRNTKYRDCIECSRGRGRGKRMHEWKMKRYYSDPVYRLKDIRRRQLRHFIKRVGETKSGRTEELLGYTAEELKTHLESLFKEGMTWDNHGKWHIDHRIPVSYFTSIDQMKECFALDNLKPEWAEWNRSKGNRFIG